MKTGSEFLGEEAAGSGDPKAYVIKVPFERTTSYMKGTSAAPGAIADASRQIELYNSSLDIDLEGAGIVTVDSGLDSLDRLSAFLGEERDRLKKAFHCFLGGEHSITPRILEGMKYGEIGILWLDAHADLRSEYQGDPDSHACAAYNSLSYGDIVEVGVRSFSAGEKSLIADDNRVRVFSTWGRDAIQAVERLPERIYLSLDFDSIDPSLLRAVGTPEPGGLGWNTLMDIFDFVFSSKEVIGMDAVELCPSPGDETSDFIAAKAVYEAISRVIALEVSHHEE